MNIQPTSRKEPTLREVLRAVLKALRGLSKRKEKLPWWRRLLEFLKVLASYFVTVFVLLVCAIVVVDTCKELRTEKVLIEPLGVPPDLEKLGYSPGVIANMLVDRQGDKTRARQCDCVCQSWEGEV